DMDGLAGLGAGGGGFDLDALLPSVGDVRGQAQRVDAGVVDLQVVPEPSGEVAGQFVHGDVVHGGLAFAQVLHQQVPHRPAGDVVPVDQLIDAALAGAPPERADGGWRVGREDPGVVEQ